MGQAKQRGTFEERKAQAMARNESMRKAKQKEFDDAMDLEDAQVDKNMLQTERFFNLLKLHEFYKKRGILTNERRN